MSKYKLELLRDRSGGTYVGFKVDESNIAKYLDQLKNMIGQDKYKLVTKNQETRDGMEFHITVLTFKEFQNVEYNEYHDFKNRLYDCVLVGLGQATSKNESTFFVVVESEEAQKIRNFFDLPARDLHITLGFTKKDIYNIPKDRSSLIQKC